MDGSSEADELAGQRHRYFQQIEEAFIGLRGAPMLLSPVDWQVARRWYEQGIPATLVVSVLEELFARRAERGQSRRVSSLRYCSRAVEDAWAQARELSGGTRRRGATPGDWRAALHRLAERLPDDLDGVARWREKLLELGSEVSAERAEVQLAALDDALLGAVAAGLGDLERERLEDRVERSIAGLIGRLPEDELEETRRRLWQQVLRDDAQLPLLSLFSRDAEH